MNVYILKTGTAIAPFGDSVAESLYVHQTMGSYMQKVLSELVGGEVISIHHISQVADADLQKGCLLIFDWVFCSKKLLKKFLGGLKNAEKSQMLTLKHSYQNSKSLAEGFDNNPANILGTSNTMIDFSLPLQEVDRSIPGQVSYDLFFLKNCSLAQIDTSGLDKVRYNLMQICERSKVDIRYFDLAPALFQGVGGDSEYRGKTFSISASFCMHIQHWLHIFRLNQLAAVMEWGEYCRKNRLWTMGMLIKMPLKKRHKLRASLKVFGKRCDIHPTAYLETSMIGDNVTIGAGAMIKGSFIGDGCRIGDNAKIHNSVLAPNCLALKNLCMVNCVCYPDSTLSNHKVQLSLLGRKVFLTSTAALADAVFQGNVKVMHQGSPVSIGTPYMGCCLGHGVKLGARVTVAPGRAIPNFCTIIDEPGRLLTTISSDQANLEEGQTYYVSEGKLVTHIPLKTPVAAPV